MNVFEVKQDNLVITEVTEEMNSQLMKPCLSGSWVIQMIIDIVILFTSSE